MTKPQTIDFEQWAKDLESGAYKQTHYRYVRDEGYGKHSYCALGVLAVTQLLAPSKSRVTNAAFERAIRESIIATMRSDPTVYHEVSRFIGRITMLNDQERMTFKEIAQFIRENYT